MTRAVPNNRLLMGLRAGTSRSRARMDSIEEVLVMDMISQPSFLTSKVKILAKS